MILIATAVIKKGNKYLLLERSVASRHFLGYWQLPEGKIDEGETASDALIRELEEELGLSLLPSQIHLLKAQELNHGGMNARREIFSVDIVPDEIVLSSEHASFSWFSKKEIEKIKTVPGTSKLIDDL